MNMKIDQLFGARLDATIPETWTTLDDDQLMKLKQCFATMIIKEFASVDDWATATDCISGQPFDLGILKRLGFDVENKLTFDVWKVDCVTLDAIDYDVQFKFLSVHGVDVMDAYANVLRDAYWNYLIDREDFHHEWISNKAC